jgi:hypothetical protein
MCSSSGSLAATRGFWVEEEVLSKEGIEEALCPFDESIEFAVFAASSLSSGG